jgi:two-component system OmpR family response regulator
MGSDLTIYDRQTLFHSSSACFIIVHLRSVAKQSVISHAVLGGTKFTPFSSGSMMPGDADRRNSRGEMKVLDNESRRQVLLVEDDDVLRRNYETLLTAHRLSVTACANKAEATTAFGKHAFDVIILDVTLEGAYEGGFELCQQFREKQKITPIIFLTERDEDHNRISGLRLGADDYLSKTISGAYLVARINALIRRIEALVGGAGESAIPTQESAILTQEGGAPLRIDDRLSRAYWNNTPLDLSLTQFWILKDLYEHKGQVRSTTELMRAASITVQPNTIVVHIKAIRDTIQVLTPKFGCIKSERARGYRWVNE